MRFFIFFMPIVVVCCAVPVLFAAPKNTGFNAQLLHALKQTEKQTEPEAPKRMTQIMTVQYLSLQELQSGLGNMFPDATFASLGGNIMVQASDRDMYQIRRLVRQLDQAPRQVRVQIDVIEIHDGKQALSQFWSPALSQGVIVGADASQGALLALQSLLGTGKARLLANPTLIVMDKKTASITVGDKIPYTTTVYSNGLAVQQIQQLDTGISIELTPRIVSENGVEVILSTRMSRVKPGSGVQSYPIVASRHAATTVTMVHQEPVAIAGLLDQQEVQHKARIPLIEWVPFVGDWFHTTQEEKVTTDIVLRITSTLL